MTSGRFGFRGPDRDEGLAEGSEGGAIFAILVLLLAGNFFREEDLLTKRKVGVLALFAEGGEMPLSTGSF